MQRSIHRSAVAVLALIAVCLTGAVTQCPWKQISVKIPDLDANQIEGLQLWRADEEASPTVSEAGRIVFVERYLESGSEMMEYTMVNALDEPVEVWPAVMRCGEEENGACTLHFIFATWSEAPGWVRVTTFNAVAESVLSEEAVFL